MSDSCAGLEEKELKEVVKEIVNLRSQVWSHLFPMFKAKKTSPVFAGHDRFPEKQSGREYGVSHLFHQMNPMF